ncbi:FAD-binding oxidoreductase [Rhodococcus aerolatus]
MSAPTDTLTAHLAGVVGEDHLRTDDGGTTVHPGSAEEVGAVLRAATAARATVLPVGAGTTVDWLPGDADVRLSTSRLDRVLEHSAGDLVVQVEAGATLESVQAALADSGQQLALDCPVPGATIGGIVAADLSGPRRYLYGTVRDLLIGTTSVRGDGVLAHSGGKVVKNVAGYDLGKLYTGSRGTLGVLTACWFRLHPLPEATRWVLAELAGTAEAAAAVAAVRSSQVTPTAIEVSRAAGSSAVVVGVALEGVAGGVGPRADTVAELLGGATGGRASVHEQAPEGWGALPGEDVLVKVAVQPTGVPAVLDALAGTLADHTVGGSAGVGVLHVGCAAADAPTVLAAARRAATEHHGSAVVLRSPAEVDALDVWGPQQGPLVTLLGRLKDEFDLGHVLAPGRALSDVPRTTPTPGDAPRPVDDRPGETR